MTTSTIDDWKELASREGDGLAVSLFWSKTADRVKVAVVDQTFDEQLLIDVPSACALDAFHHPFAYATRQGVDCPAGSAATAGRPERSAVR